MGIVHFYLATRDSLALCDIRQRDLIGSDDAGFDPRLESLGASLWRRRRSRYDEPATVARGRGRWLNPHG